MAERGLAVSRRAGAASTAPMEQLVLPISAAPAPSFGNFIAGANAPALAHLEALAPGAGPSYLWGPEGSGKSHLLQATARAWQARGGGAAARFGADSPWPWQLGDETLILLDDCERYDAPRQHAAFTCFVAAADGGRSVLAAGRLPPVDLPLREDLRTRLGSGPVFGLAPLGEADTRAALRGEAARRGLHLAEELLDYLLTHFARDLKHLSGLLEGLDAYAMRHRRAPTLPLLRQMLAEAAKTDEGRP